MIKEQQKREILALVENEAKVLGSYNRLATKLGISSAAISNNIRRPENWGNVADSTWANIGKILRYSFRNNGWVVVDTENMRIMKNVMQMAQNKAMFLAVSEKAGSGKTISMETYKTEDETNAVYMLQCEEWNRKAFLIRLAQCCGVDTKDGYVSADTIGEKIIKTLKQKAAVSMPLVLLDEADKLRPGALRWLIHLYNKLEDEIGVVIAGSENLKKQIKSGVNRAVKGYDEIDSRFGRSFVRLVGCTREDANRIAVENGLTDTQQIERIWNLCRPIEITQSGKYIEIIEDIRTFSKKVKASVGLGSSLRSE